MSKIGMFRAQITETKEWVEGFYTQKKTGKFTHGSYQERFADCIITYFSDGGINAQEIDPTTLEYLGEQDGCEYCKDLALGEYGKALFDGDNDGEMRLFRSSDMGYYIDVAVNDAFEYKCNAMFPTKRCFNCGKRLGGH